MSNSVRIPAAELEMALRRFEIGWPHKDTCPWYVFIGVKVTPKYDNLHMPVKGYYSTPEAYAKIQALCGPHWSTMLKVWSVQYRQELKLKWDRIHGINSGS